MVTICALLALAVALWCILRVIGGSVLELSNSNRISLCWSACANPLPELHCGMQGGESRFVGRSIPTPPTPSGHPDWAGRSLKMRSLVHEIGTIEPIHILSIGQCKPCHTLSDELLDIPGFKVSSVLDYRELIQTIRYVPALVLVHDSLQPVELEDACRLVRQNWRFARILVIRDGEEFLEDALYDDRVLPDISGKDLIVKILFLVQTLDLWRPNNGRR